MRRIVGALMLFLAAATIAAAKGSAQEPILGVTWSGRGELAWLDPLTLTPMVRTRFQLAAGFSTARSRDGTMVAVASGSTLRVLDARSLRIVRTVRGSSISLSASVWTRPNRLVTAPSWFTHGSAIVLDPLSGRIVAQRPLRGVPIALASSRDAVVLLLGKDRQIGPVRLAIVGADGSVRSVVLPALLAGFRPLRPGSEVSRWAQPGLAVDPSGSRAAVVVPGLIAEVELASLKVRLHRLDRRKPSSTRKAFSGWTRRAVWAAP